MMEKKVEKQKINLDARNKVIIEAIHEPVLILNTDLRILFANKHFYSTFQLKKDEVVGKLIYDLAGKTWDIPEFHSIKTDLLKKDATSVFLRIEHDLSGSVKHGIYLNAIRFPEGEKNQCMVALLFENIIEQKLQESMEFQRSIFETTSLPTAILAADKTILGVNREFEKLSGFSKKEIENKKTFSEFITPEYLSLVEKRHDQRRIDPQKTPKHYEFQIKTRNGEIRDVLLNADLIPGTQESVVSLLDMTERNQVERALLESEEKFKFIFDNSVIGKLLSYPSEEMYFNQAYCDMLGYTREELKHKKWQELVHPQEFENFQKKMKALLSRESSSLHFMTRLVKKDQSIVWANILLSIRFDKNNEPMYYFATIVDLTERIKIEEQLRESMNFQKVIFETTTLPTTILGEDKTILISNRQFELLSGYTKEEIEGKKKWMEFVDPEYRSMMEQYHEKRRITPNEVPLQYEFKFIDRKGEKKDIFLSVNIIPGTMKSVACLFNITELKRNEKALQEANVIINRGPAVAFLWKNTSGWPVEFASENVDKLFGYSAKEFANGQIAYTDTIHHDDLARVASEVKKHSNIEGLQSFTHEPYRIITKAKEVKWIEDITYIRRGRHGEITHYEGIVYDITARKMAEEKLQISENNYRSVVEHAPILMANFLPDGTITFVNKAYCDYFGIPNEKIVGKTIYSSIPEYERQSMRDRLTNCSQETPLFVTENRVNKSGELRWMRWTNSAFFNEQGKVIYFQSYGQDIHERKRVDELLYALNQAAVAMGSAFSVDEIFAVVANQLGELAITCQLFPVDETKKRFFTKYLHFDQKLIAMVEKWLQIDHENYSFPIDIVEPYQNAIQEKKVIFIADTKYLVKKVIPSVAAKLTDPIIKSFHSSKSIVTPLIVDDDVIGIFSVQSDHLREEDVPIFTVFADQLASAWKKVELLQDLKKTIDGTILTIAATVEMRDPYTAGHQTRVADLAVAIARKMNLSETQIESIHMAGIIHDLGKINVPAEILSKPGKISPLEFEIIKTHPQVGYDLLKKIKFPWPLAQIVYQHHEKMDGSGYPQGLKEDNIMIEARILCVADIVEAMSSHRPYRPSLGIDKALAQIRKDRGTLLDAKAVDACLELFDQGYELLNAEH
jgi:PAS domain S-box-containing protein/putative nucleotidyltransferase with HDIG domain